jgi:hypothetical protein
MLVGSWSRLQVIQICLTYCSIELGSASQVCVLDVFVDYDLGADVTWRLILVASCPCNCTCAPPHAGPGVAAQLAEPQWPGGAAHGAPEPALLAPLLREPGRAEQDGGHLCASGPGCSGASSECACRPISYGTCLLFNILNPHREMRSSRNAFTWLMQRARSP